VEDGSRDVWVANGFIPLKKEATYTRQDKFFASLYLILSTITRDLQYVYNKFEVPTFRYRVNCRHGTDGRGATLYRPAITVSYTSARPWLAVGLGRRTTKTAAYKVCFGDN